MKTSRLFIGIIIGISLALSSCASTPDPELTDSTTPREIIQYAQTSYDKGKTQKALEYYDILIKRFGTNTALYVEAKYEIGHIQMKEKYYSKARVNLQEVVDIYSGARNGSIPGAFYILAKNDLEKCEGKKDAPRLTFWDKLIGR